MPPEKPHVMTRAERKSLNAINFALSPVCVGGSYEVSRDGEEVRQFLLDWNEGNVHIWPEYIEFCKNL